MLPGSFPQRSFRGDFEDLIHGPLDRSFNIYISLIKALVENENEVFIEVVFDYFHYKYYGYNSSHWIVVGGERILKSRIFH